MDEKIQNYNAIGASRPEKKIRAGAISATIWKNSQVKDGKTFEYKSVSFERSYKDKTGQWKTTNSLKIQDLPKAKAVLDEAYKYLIFNTNISDSANQEVMI